MRFQHVSGLCRPQDCRFINKSHHKQKQWSKCLVSSHTSETMLLPLIHTQMHAFPYAYQEADSFKMVDHFSSVQLNSVAQSCPALWDTMDCSMPGLSVNHQLPEFTQTIVHWVGDAIQPSRSLLFPSPPAFSRSQGPFQWVTSLHQVAKLLELQHQCFQWIFRTNFL